LVVIPSAAFSTPKQNHRGDTRHLLFSPQRHETLAKGIPSHARLPSPRGATARPLSSERSEDLLFTLQRRKPLAKKIANLAHVSSGHGFSRAKKMPFVLLPFARLLRKFSCADLQHLSHSSRTCP
jgi:hypothetical protein